MVRRCALKPGMHFIHTNVAGNRIQAIRSARRSVILIRIRALIRIWVNQGFPAVSVWDDPCAYGQPICVRAAHTRTGCPYTYGLPIRVWAKYLYGTEQLHLCYSYGNRIASYSGNYC